MISSIWVEAILNIDFPGREVAIKALLDRYDDDFWKTIPDRHYFFKHIHPLLTEQLLRM